MKKTKPAILESKKITFIFGALCIFLESNAFALPGADCVTKEKNAAAFAFAQAAPAPVQNVKIVSFQVGRWTEYESENSGCDIVTVMGKRLNRGLTLATYSIKAKQVGVFETCEIISVEEGTCN